MRKRVTIGGLGVVLFLLLFGCTYMPALLGDNVSFDAADTVWIDAGVYYDKTSLAPLSVTDEPILPTDPDTGLRYYPHLLVVAMKEGKFTDLAIKELLKKYNLTVKGKIKVLRMVLFGVPEGADLRGLKDALALEPSVEAAGFEYVFEYFTEAGAFSPMQITNDLWYPLSQWGLFKIGFNELASSVLPTSAPTIAIVDSGIDYTHPDITKSKVVLGPDYFDGDMNPMDTFGHGTHVAGIAAAVTSNDLGIAGVSGRSKLLAIRVGGSGGLPVFACAAGIVYAANNTQVKVINLSWGGSSDIPFIRDAVAYAVSKGKLVVAAAGNENTTSPRYPAAYPGVLGVGASTQTDGRASFSNYGTYVDIAAPGVEILSTVPGGGYQEWDGTSMAAPFVAGAAALLWGKWSTLTSSEVAYLLTSTGDPVSGFPSGVKRLDVANAFRYKLGSLPPPGGALLGIVIDANTGFPIAQATVTAKSGSVSKTAKTRANGTFTITDMPAGWYTVTASKGGYATTMDIWQWRIYDAQWTFLVYLPLPKSQPSTVYTAVLRWFGYEDYGCEDLDLYLWLPYSLSDRDKYIAYYADRGHDKVHPYARYLRDEPLEMPGRFWYPLYCEAVTFQAKYSGVYRMAVYNLDWTSTYGWTYSEAVVTLYRGSQQIANCYVGQASGSGRWWTVFEVSGSYVYLINYLGASYPGFYGEEDVLAALMVKPEFQGMDIEGNIFVPDPSAGSGPINPLPNQRETRRVPAPGEKVPR